MRDFVSLIPRVSSCPSKPDESTVAIVLAPDADPVQSCRKALRFERKGHEETPSLGRDVDGVDVMSSGDIDPVRDLGANEMPELVMSALVVRSALRKTRTRKPRTGQVY